MNSNLYWYKATYVTAYDGDTITVDIDLGFGAWLKGQTVRLYGIDAPEIKGVTHDAGIITRDYVRQRLSATPDILLYTYKDKKEKYGRWLADIYIREEKLNQTLLNRNLAIEYIL